MAIPIYFPNVSRKYLTAPMRGLNAGTYPANLDAIKIATPINGIA
jgi:hypothetical protein